MNDLELDLTQVYAKRHRLELVVHANFPERMLNDALHIVAKQGGVGRR